jgi:hypothetical protein
VTTKKLVREIEHSVYPNGEFEKPETVVSRLERKYTFSQVEHESIAKFEEAINSMALSSISDLFDRQTVVLTNSEGQYYSVRSHDIISAKAYVTDSLDAA